MIDANYRDWLVTVKNDETSTQDHYVRAHSAYSARAQFLQIYPNARITAVRLRHR